MNGSRKADWVSVDRARELVLNGVPRLGTELLSLGQAAGRVLADDIRASVALPPWDNSAMDGFAVRAEDVRGASETAPRVLRVIEDVPAGQFPTRSLSAGEAIRVMTGAPIPAGADGVIRVEHTDHARGSGPPRSHVDIRSDADAGKNVRLRGEDVAEGEVTLRKGMLLRPGEIGVAAALGQARLRVGRRPRVALLASGDELVDVAGYAEVLAGKRIVSSNSYSVAAQIGEAGGEVVDLGIAADTPESIRDSLEAARGCDALVTVAGMSVGEHDHMIAVLAEMGTEVAFWRVRMRPGSPFAFGMIGSLGGIPWFGLPGNPVSAVVTSELFVRPALLRMAGADRVYPPAIPVRAADRIEGGAGLTRFHRVRLRYAPDGPPHAELTGSQGSGILTSTVEADALLVIEASLERVEPGDTLPAILLGGRPLLAEPGYGA